ncbi:MAG: acetyltransferase-like isoleucine patch superfamily enzyme [Colwellia sp.]|jgi:acetyltransferase-like isoleucine patch superfamily enzyme
MLKKLLHKIRWFLYLPLSRKQQYLTHNYLKVKGIVVYRLLFKKFGQGAILKQALFVSYESIEVGQNVLIFDHARIEAIDCYSEHGIQPLIIIGDGVVIQQRCHITAASTLSIGKNSLISFDVMIQDTDHQYENLEVPVGSQPLTVTKTTIGENCFIGSGAKINAGTTLGKHCIVGANSVVRGNFPDYSVIVGIPAKIIKRYNPETLCWERTTSTGDFIQNLGSKK